MAHIFYFISRTGKFIYSFKPAGTSLLYGTSTSLFLFRRIGLRRIKNGIDFALKLSDIHMHVSIQHKINCEVYFSE